MSNITVVAGRYLVTLQDREPVAKIGRILQEAFPQCGIPLGEEGKPIPTFDGSRVSLESSTMHMACGGVAEEWLSPAMERHSR